MIKYLTTIQRDNYFFTQTTRLRGLYKLFRAGWSTIGQPVLVLTQSFSWNSFETDISGSVVEIVRAYSEHNVRTGKVLSLQADSAQ